MCALRAGGKVESVLLSAFPQSRAQGTHGTDAGTGMTGGNTPTGPTHRDNGPPRWRAHAATEEGRPGRYCRAAGVAGATRPEINLVTGAGPGGRPGSQLSPGSRAVVMPLRTETYVATLRTRSRSAASATFPARCFALAGRSRTTLWTGRAGYADSGQSEGPRLVRGTSFDRVGVFASAPGPSEAVNA